MNKKTNNPLLFGKSAARNLESKVEHALKSHEIPIEIKDIIEHDVLNKVNQVVHLYQDEDAQKDLSSEDIRKVNANFQIANDLISAIRLWSYTTVVPVYDPVQSAVFQFKDSDLYDGTMVNLDIQTTESSIASKPFIQLMVQNLLKNTLTYAKDTKKVDVSVEETDKFVVVKVADYGSTPMDLKSTIERKKSAGLGAGTSANSTKWLLERYGGKLTHYHTDKDAKKYVGTTFELSFKKPTYEVKRKFNFQSSQSQLEAAAISKINYLQKTSDVPSFKK